MIIEIEKKLKNMILKIVKNETLLSVKGIQKKIDVFRGIIPYEKAGEILPAIAIRASKGKNYLEKRELEVSVIFETTNPNTEIGYEEHMRILQQIIDEVISKGTVDNIAEISPEVNWEFFDEQAYPNYISHIIFKIISRKAYRTDVDAWIKGEWE